jgi:hypothetical protein
MKLSHTTSKDPKKLLNILKSGYLKPAIDLDEENIFNDKPNLKLKAVYFNFYDIKYKNDFNITFILDSNFLLDKTFYFCIGWNYNNCLDEYNFKTKKDLDNLYKANIKYIKSYEIYFKRKRKLIPTENFKYIGENFCYKFTHEILFENKVSLHDYLLEIFLHIKDEQLEEYIKANYPKCKINRVYNDPQYIQYLLDKEYFNFYSKYIDN